MGLHSSRLLTISVPLLCLFMTHPLNGSGVMAWSPSVSPLIMAVSPSKARRSSGSRRRKLDRQVESLSGSGPSRKSQRQSNGRIKETSNAGTRSVPRKSTPKNRQKIQLQQQQLSNNNNSDNILPSPPPPPRPPNSVGQAVQQALTVTDLLQVAADLWLPTDFGLQSHLRTQAVHHEKRQRWSAQLLVKLGDVMAQQEPSTITDDNIWKDERLARAVLAAAYPQFDNAPHGGTEKEQRSVVEALLGLHVMMGKQPPPPQGDGCIHPDVTKGIDVLIERAEAMADHVPLYEAAQVRWAARGILARLNIEDYTSNKKEFLAASLPNLERRVAGLPFDIIPLGVDVDQLVGDTFTALHECIPFNFDTITTRTGVEVIERRGTAWVAEEGIGAMAYSGKLMPPSPLPDLVRTIMRRVEHAIDLYPSAEHDNSDGPAPSFFDCALCNYYPDEEAACRFHTDPEHGTSWERLNCVVAVGESRRFAFRPIAGVSKWSDWEPKSPSSRRATEDDENTPAVIQFPPNDIVSMWGTCNDDFHHAVYRATAVPEGAPSRGRISLVLKRAMVHGNNRRGHGLAGEGRRSRRHRLQ